MSLISYLGSDSLTGSTSGALSPAVASALQTIADATGTDSSTALTNLNGPSYSATITLAAQQAAAEQADSGKDATSLAIGLRQALDTQYAASGAKAPALGSVSNRGLAVIALNASGAFSKAEVFAAKTELRDRDKSAFLQNIATNGLSVSTLQAYQTAQTSALAASSAEERQLREIDPSLR